MSTWSYPSFQVTVFQHLDEDGVEIVPGIFVHVHCWDSEVGFRSERKHSTLWCRCGAFNFYDNPTKAAEE